MNKKEIIKQLEERKKLLELNHAPHLCFDNNYLRHKVTLNMLCGLMDYNGETMEENYIKPDEKYNALFKQLKELIDDVNKSSLKDKHMLSLVRMHTDLVFIANDLRVLAKNKDGKAVCL